MNEQKEKKENNGVQNLVKTMNSFEDVLELLRDTDLIDLNIDTKTPMNLVGYDPKKRLSKGREGKKLFAHEDLPGIRENSLDGAMWSVSASSFRSSTGRWRQMERSIADLRQFVLNSDILEVVSNVQEYKKARSRNKHALMLALQGGNALDAGVDSGVLPDPGLVRVTILNWMGSQVGGSANPFGISSHLTEHGMALVQMLDEARIFVDLAYCHPDSFWEAYVIHDRTLPLLVSHTGVKGVKAHWRNLDDAQLRAIAETGGVVGIMFQSGFWRRTKGGAEARIVAEHIRHAIKVAGEDCVGIGSAHDGFALPPTNRQSTLGYASVAYELLKIGISEQVLRKIMGGNFLRAFKEIRPS